MQRTKNTTAAVGVAGAIIGAGITAAAVALSDKKTREKITATLLDVGKQAEKTMHDIRKTTNEVVPEAKKAMETGERVIEEISQKTEHPIAS